MQGDDPQPGHSYYLDFEVEIGEGKGREYPVAVIRSPTGEARETMHFPFDELALENHLVKLDNALLRSGGQRRRIPSEEEQAVRTFGQALFDALLSGEIRDCYNESRLEAARQRKGLRLKLRIHPPEMNALPWEFLYDPRRAEYVCLSLQTPVVRYLEAPYPVQPLTVMLPIRILCMVADPADQRSLGIDREKERVKRALRDLQSRGLVELEWLPGQTRHDLHEAMWRGPWHIFHFLGHGGFDVSTDEGFLVLADGEGRTSCLSATGLSLLLADHAPLRLVLLNACEGARGSERDLFSSTAATLVRRGIPAVVAMQREITDRAAIEFVRAFYRALAHGIPVDRAVVEARKAISLEVANTVEWGTPVLYMRSLDGVLFEIAKLEHDGRPTPSVGDVREAPSEEDDELGQRLERLYTDGLSAFFRKEWDEACRSFQAIVEVRPDYRSGSVALKLEEAKRQERLQSLYDKALAARDTGDWETAIGALEELVAEQFDYKDAAALLEASKRQKKLRALYGEAQYLHQAAEWQAVVGVFAQIAALDPDYPDPDDLLSRAERKVAEQRRNTELDDLHSRALLEMDAGRWLAARQLLVQLQRMEPGYRDVEPLLDRAEAEITRQEAEGQRQEKVDLLYDQARELAAAQDWQQALDRMQGIHEIDPRFADPEGIAARAEEELARQKRLEDLYTQAQAAGEAGDWPGAIAALEALTSEAAGYRDAADMLEEAKRQKQLAGLYAEAQQHHQAGEWLAVLSMFEQITAIEPDYADPEGLHAAARQEIEAQERRMEVEDLYGRALAAVNEERWPEAQRLLRQVQEREPGYQDVEQLAAAAETEVERAEAERQRQERITALYGEAQDLALAGHWRQAQIRLDEILALDPAFADPEGIGARAEEGVARQEEEERRKSELASLYAEAVRLLGAKQYGEALEKWGEIETLDSSYPDRQKVQATARKKLAAAERPAVWQRLPRWALAAGGGLVLMAVIAVAIIATGVLKTPEPTPEPTEGGEAAPPIAGATQVWEPDDSVMVYVPAGTFWMGSDESDSLAEDNEKPQHEVYLDVFWIDRTEVTNAMFARFVDDTGYETDAEKRGSSWMGNPSSGEWEDTAGADWQHPYGPSTNLEGLDQHPVVHVSWNDAAAYCQWADKRLPTEAEWEKAARGTDGRIYPWGDTLDGSLVNFCDTNCELDWSDEDWDDGYADTAPVGSYAGGASPYGVLDMAGNVWEWVADWYDGDYYDGSPERNPQGPSSGELRVLRGGSWVNNERVVRAAARRNVGPSDSGLILGFRCARSDSESSPVPTLSPARTRTPEPTDTAVPPTDMPTNTPTSTAMLTPTPPAIVTEVWEPDDSVMVYVPAGTFWMGSDDKDSDAEDDEKPQHEVYLDAFWIDRTEVTNARYQRCVEDGACSPPADTSSKTHDSYFGNAYFDHHPVIHVDWEQANAYCTWAGKRLPTEAEWEKAARGTDRRTYPWGEGIDCDHANYWICVGDTTQVGSLPQGASPYGALDMAGNVWEWTSSLYKVYPYDGEDGREDLTTNGWRVARGGLWNNSESRLRAANRGYAEPSSANYRRGFRCARSGSESTPVPLPSLALTRTPEPTDTAAPPTDIPTITSTWTPTLTPTPPAIVTEVWKEDDSVMVYVPAGTFWMGSTDEDIDAILAECSGCERDWYDDEMPQHEVYLDAFWIDRTEVTNAMFARFVDDTGYETDAEKRGSTWTSYNPSSGEWEDTAGADWQHPYGPSTNLDGLDEHPVMHVSWNDAAAYCQWAEKRLPTEAEWEKAARGTEGRIYPWGDTFDGSLPNSCDTNCELYWRDEDWDDGYADTAPVGSSAGGSSPYGAMDMAGNVYEWVADWFEDAYYARSPDRNPQGPESGSRRVVRGGSWVNIEWVVRAAYRLDLVPSASYDYLGFRCARSGSEP